MVCGRAEADRDRDAARSAAADLGIAFFTRQVDALSEAGKRDLSVEEACRLLRYQALEAYRVEMGADFIVTGHNADDNAEAVLLNLLRGAGAGRSGRNPAAPGQHCPTAFEMAPPGNHGLSGKRWYCLLWRDGSNRDPVYRRNSIRLDLLPRLRRKYNPRVEEALTRTAELLRAEESFWEKILDEAALKAGWNDEYGCVSLSAAGLAEMDPAVARRLIRRAVGAVKGDTGGLEKRHVDMVMALDPGGGKAVDLPGNARRRARRRPNPVSTEANASKSGVRLFPAGARPCRHRGNRSDGHSRSYGPGAHRPPRFHSKPGLGGLGSNRVAAFWVRNMARADRFSPLGLRGTKKLSDFFTDLKVPPRERARAPLICDENGIVWVGGYRIDHRVPRPPGNPEGPQAVDPISGSRRGRTNWPSAYGPGKKSFPENRGNFPIFLEDFVEME